MKKLFEKPKYVITLALIVAIAIGITCSVYIQKNRNGILQNNSVTVDSVSTNTESKNLTLAFPIGGRIANVFVKIGDKVKTGETLASLDSENALGAVNQAKGAYAVAQNNLDKLINGATNSDIEVAKVALDNAKKSYDNIVSQQKVLVSTALSNLRNSGLAAVPAVNSQTTIISPTISGTYTGSEDGAYTINLYPNGSGYYFSVSGLENGTGNVSTVATPLGTKGLYIQFPNNFSVTTNNTWTISIPNNQSPTYLVNYNAYQMALQNQTQATASAKGAVDSAQANLNQKIAGTRSEDLKIASAQVESTKGALQVAESVYNNTIITSPINGTVTNVKITAGQIATPNSPAIELSSK